MRADDPFDVSFQAAGAFNRLYLVVRIDRPLIMRVSRPVHPTYKTRGEVATLQWVRANTSIPVPRVIAFDDSNNNEIGFEWILMERMPGSPAYQRWRKMSMDQKVSLTKQLAEYQAELSFYGDPRFAFRGIGTLQPQEGQLVTPGQVVSLGFFWGEIASSTTFREGLFARALTG